MPANYSEAISRGVQNWLDANKDTVLEIIEKRVNTSMEVMAKAMTKKADSFFDDNREEIISAVSAAIVYILKSKNLLPMEGKRDKGQG